MLLFLFVPPRPYSPIIVVLCRYITRLQLSVNEQPIYTGVSFGLLCPPYTIGVYPATSYVLKSQRKHSTLDGKETHTHTNMLEKYGDLVPRVAVANLWWLTLLNTYWYLMEIILSKELLAKRKENCNFPTFLKRRLRFNLFFSAA